VSEKLRTFLSKFQVYTCL